MRSVTFKYKGAMIKTTNALNESFCYTGPVSTVKDALLALNKHYDNRLSQYTNENVSVILEKDASPGVLINTDETLDIELGDTNVITFFSHFKGG